MREAIGSSLLLNIVVVFIGVISAILISSITYSKAFKAKNLVVSTIENYNGVCFDNLDTDPCFKEIEQKLVNMGYSSNISHDCPEIADATLVYPKINYQIGHRYCVYRYDIYDTTNVAVGSEIKQMYDENSNKMHYYKVITFMHFDFPLIGQFLEFQVSGETRTFYDTFINIKK